MYYLCESKNMIFSYKLQYTLHTTNDNEKYNI